MQGKVAPDGRPVVEVALGVLIDRVRGVYLMGSRPDGKPYAGYWEFPGGKVEPGERVTEALKREFVEELGLNLLDMTPWFVLEHSYEHAYVRLHYYRVWSWEGEPVSREKQSFDWFNLGSYDPTVPMLPMNALVVKRMTVPEVLLEVANPESATIPEEVLHRAQGFLMTKDRAKDVFYAGALRRLAQQCGKTLYTPDAVVDSSDKASSDGLQEALFGWVRNPEHVETILAQQTQRLPLVVAADDVNELPELIAQGAHGISLKI